MRNASIPPFSVIPVLAYDDVRTAVGWLTTVFGFTEQTRIDDHRSQLSTGAGAVIIADATSGRRAPNGSDGISSSVMIRVDDVDEHFRATAARAAEIVSEPADHAYGERQYSVRDPGGHVWTFTQSIADVTPESWGGITVSPW